VHKVISNKGNSVEATAFGHPKVPATTDLSQLVRAGPFLFLSGQIGVGSDGRLVGPAAGEQINQAFMNVGRLLQMVGASLKNVVKLTSYLTNADDKIALQRIRREFFTPPFPASTLLIVKQLASPDYLYEVDVVAVVDAELKAFDAARRID
jgi:2-iminobutanoate/2-iminopropanoate deaminase